MNTFESITLRTPRSGANAAAFDSLSATELDHGFY